MCLVDASPGSGDVAAALGLIAGRPDDVFVRDPVVRDALAWRVDFVDMEVSDNADEQALDWPARVDRSG